MFVVGSQLYIFDSLGSTFLISPTHLIPLPIFKHIFNQNEVFSQYLPKRCRLLLPSIAIARLR